MNKLRPTRLSDIIGQTPIKEQLSISISSTKKLGEVFPHTLFSGPAGLGKTTLANSLAAELGVNIYIANAANISSLKKILPYTSKLRRGDILFIDEIHRLPNKLQEFLFPVMEDFRIDMSNDKVAYSMELEQFTLVGATTESGSLLEPLRDRFQKRLILEPYEPSELLQILNLNCPKLGVKMAEDAAQSLSERSRGVARILNNYLEWIRDYSVAKNIAEVSLANLNDAMSIIGIDNKGLSPQDRLYIEVLKNIQNKTGKPVGLKTLISSSGLNAQTVECEIEPFLLRNKIIIKTSKGRTLA